METTAYIDFRKDRNGNAKGRRFAKRGKDFVDNPDEIEVLRQYKTERDSILGLNKGAEPKKQEISGHNYSNNSVSIVPLLTFLSKQARI
jgi:hypothetical protein